MMGVAMRRQRCGDDGGDGEGATAATQTRNNPDLDFIADDRFDVTAVVVVAVVVRPVHTVYCCVDLLLFVEGRRALQLSSVDKAGGRRSEHLPG